MTSFEFQFIWKSFWRSNWSGIDRL